MAEQKDSKLSLFPLTAEINNKEHLAIGGCDTVALAEEFGTPLYVYDEATLRRKCAEFRTEFGQRYPDVLVLYASKAFACKALLKLVKDEGLGLDVVSAGEMSIAQATSFPMERVYAHGNNKSAEELRLALEWDIGRIVVDNFHELELLRGIVEKKQQHVDVLLRLSPGIDPHTHRYNTTGIVDSKFGFTKTTWEESVTRVMSIPRLHLVGLHFHLGSLIFEVEPYQEAAGIVLGFAAGIKEKHGLEMKELDVGGGFGVQYVLGEVPPPVSRFAEVITGAVKGKCRELGLPLPKLVLEPGRAIVAHAGVALYRVGAIKDIPGIRRYVSVDGGMGDNIRHALYGAKHEAMAANKALAEDTELVTIAGKFCESGDILLRDIKLPPLAAGDLLAVAESGAYCIPMSSNYNASLRPAVVIVRDGKARLIRGRETFADLTRHDKV